MFDQPFHFDKLQVHLNVRVSVEVFRRSCLDAPVGRELFITECHLSIAVAPLQPAVDVDDSHETEHFFQK